MTKLCIFDLDGTLLNTLPTITYYVNRELQKYGKRGISVEECRTVVGNGARLICERSAALVGLEAGKVEKMLSDYAAAYDASPLYLTEPYAGIADLMAALRERNIKIAVFSNKPHTATLPIVRHFFGDFVSEIRGAKPGVPLKPDPAACFEILSSLGVSPDETVYIGDSGVDMKVGKSLGARRTVGVTWGFRDRAELLSEGADALVDSPLELLTLL